MNLYQQLALLTDDESKLCLNGILKGLTSLKPQYETLFASKEQMVAVIDQVPSEIEQLYASDIDNIINQIDNIINQNEPKAIRFILTEIADNPETSPRLEAWFSTARPKLLEPVTSALVLAGIILLLSTYISIEYENQDGKNNLKVKIEKKSTSDKILKKFLSFFS